MKSGNFQSEVEKAALEMSRIDTHSHIDLEMSNLRDSIGQEPILPMSGRILAAACMALYDIDVGSHLTLDAPEEVFLKAAKLRKQGMKAAYETAFNLARIKVQLNITGSWPERADFSCISYRIRKVAWVDDAIMGNQKAFCPDGLSIRFNYYESLCSMFGRLDSLDDYISSLNSRINHWLTEKVVAMKTARAYTLGLRVTDPSDKEAKRAFAKKDKMSPKDIRSVQDYAFRYCLDFCVRLGLPVLVHTGFQIWGHANLAQSNPLHLHNLLVDQRYKSLKFVLLHGGNPYVGETTYLATMFPNVIIDFTWIGWMSPTRFRFALAEWLEVVPVDRFCWGSDSSSPETIVGIDRIMRTQIAEVLKEQIHHKVISEDYALQFLEYAYQKTPLNIFRLKDI